jgi:hypothetical protein
MCSLLFQLIRNRLHFVRTPTGHACRQVPKRIKQLLQAESGCNDGILFPFLYAGSKTGSLRHLLAILY